MSRTVHMLITQPFSEEELGPLKKISKDLNIELRPTRQPEEIAEEVWAQTEVLYTWRVLPEPEQAPNLRWIQFHQAGVDNALERPILRQPNLQITTMSGANAPQAAEHILTMLLALCYQLSNALALQNRSEWPVNRMESIPRRELRDATVGIVGYGSIGRELARLLHGLGVEILATKRDVMHPADNGYAPDGMGDPGGDYAKRLYPAQALRSMFKDCDFVVVTVPLTAETRGMIGAQQFKAMKPSAFLVDISRGGIVDHAALLAALNENEIAGAALDVFPEEPLPADSPLWEMPNVIITPHIAGMTASYGRRALDLFAENLKRYLAEEPLHNLVDLSRGY